jgi:hypothetical protein
MTFDTIIRRGTVATIAAPLPSSIAANLGKRLIRVEQ